MGYAGLRAAIGGGAGTYAELRAALVRALAHCAYCRANQCTSTAHRFLRDEANITAIELQRWWEANPHDTL